MRKSRFTEDQIIAMLKEQNAGMVMVEMCRRLGPSPTSLYRFKAKTGGMNVSDTDRQKTIHDENTKLKRLIERYVLK